ncbi:MAG: sensor histidine kinase, partial [Clostridia bacterium]|nr:sensor histidine kinase [Clostridia bacterium]
CGISPETGARIFDKFYQGETSHAGEGNGLGLALVKKVIDLLGGEIKVESELHKGTSFTVVLKGL